MVVEVVEHGFALLRRHALEAVGEERIDEERLAAGDRMGARHRVHMLGGSVTPSLVHAAESRRVEVRLTRDVQRTEAVQHLPHALRQGLVGEVHVGEQGVAPDRRELPPVEHGASRRRLQEGEVGVPVTAPVSGLLGLLHDLDDLRVSLEPCT